MARSLDLDVEELERDVAASRARLYEARRQRVPPGLDDKVITAWNGLMIGALAEGYRVRVYIPFGRQWFPYFMRRLGERPANVGFVLRGLARDRG